MRIETGEPPGGAQGVQGSLRPCQWEGVQVGKVQGLLVVPFPVIGSQPSENAEAGS